MVGRQNRMTGEKQYGYVVHSHSDGHGSSDLPADVFHNLDLAYDEDELGQEGKADQGHLDGEGREA